VAQVPAEVAITDVVVEAEVAEAATSDVVVEAETAEAPKAE
jgi:hypothetical protein